MSTESIEQYRAGFEAKMRAQFGDDLSFDRDDQGYISDSWRDAFIGWVAAKSEASTEPSVQGGREAGLLAQGKTAEARMDAGSAGGLLGGHKVAGALPDEAKVARTLTVNVMWPSNMTQMEWEATKKDAARYRFMRNEATGNFIRFIPYSKPIEIDEAIDAAIQASTKTGSRQ